MFINWLLLTCGLLSYFATHYYRFILSSGFQPYLQTRINWVAFNNNIAQGPF